jgi:hypothetical protein
MNDQHNEQVVTSLDQKIFFLSCLTRKDYKIVEIGVRSRAGEVNNNMIPYLYSKAVARIATDSTYFRGENKMHKVKY